MVYRQVTKQRMTHLTQMTWAIWCLRTAQGFPAQLSRMKQLMAQLMAWMHGKRALARQGPPAEGNLFGRIQMMHMPGSMSAAVIACASSGCMRLRQSSQVNCRLVLQGSITNPATYIET